MCLFDLHEKETVKFETQLLTSVFDYEKMVM